MGAAQVTAALASEQCDECCCPTKDRLSRRGAASGGGRALGEAGGVSGRASAEASLPAAAAKEAEEDVEKMIEKLFSLQDLNDNGVLEEAELVQLNKKVAMLHYGRNIDKEKVRETYQELFRRRLNPEGAPVSLDTFRQYIRDVLEAIDKDRAAQGFILEQWISEAGLARVCFSVKSMQSFSDLEFLLLKDFDADTMMASAVVEESEAAKNTPPVSTNEAESDDSRSAASSWDGSLPPGTEPADCVCETSSEEAEVQKVQLDSELLPPTPQLPLPRRTDGSSASLSVKSAGSSPKPAHMTPRVSRAAQDQAPRVPMPPAPHTTPVPSEVPSSGLLSRGPSLASSAAGSGGSARHDFVLGLELGQPPGTCFSEARLTGYSLGSHP